MGIDPQLIPIEATRAAQIVLSELFGPTQQQWQNTASMRRIIAAAVDAAGWDLFTSGDRDEWLATQVAQREHAEIATRAILQQTDMMQRYCDQNDAPPVLESRNPDPTAYEVWRDSLMIAATADAYRKSGPAGSADELARYAESIRLVLLDCAEVETAENAALNDPPSAG